MGEWGWFVVFEVRVYFGVKERRLVVWFGWFNFERFECYLGIRIVFCLWDLDLEILEREFLVLNRFVVFGFLILRDIFYMRFFGKYIFLVFIFL